MEDGGFVGMMFEDKVMYEAAKLAACKVDKGICDGNAQRDCMKYKTEIWNQMSKFGEGILAIDIWKNYLWYVVNTSGGTLSITK